MTILSISAWDKHGLIDIYLTLEKTSLFMCECHWNTDRNSATPVLGSEMPRHWCVQRPVDCHHSLGRDHRKSLWEWWLVIGCYIGYAGMARLCRFHSHSCPPLSQWPKLNHNQCPTIIIINVWLRKMKVQPLWTNIILVWGFILIMTSNDEAFGCPFLTLNGLSHNHVCLNGVVRWQPFEVYVYC